MPERIDVLRTPVNNGSSFTVNTAVASVPLVPHVSGLPQTLIAEGNTKEFQRGDNFTILSCGFVLPESFIMANQTTAPMAAIDLAAFKTVSLGIVALEAVGSSGRMAIPFPNYELNLGVFVDTEQSLINEAFYLQAKTTPNSVQISMLNVPAAFNGLTFEVPLFIKVLHNFTLT